MTNPESSQQDAELNPESPPDEMTAGVDDETAGFDEEAAEEAVTADYQTRLSEFDNVESVPVDSVPVQSSELDESDLKLQSPGSQGS